MSGKTYLLFIRGLEARISTVSINEGATIAELIQKVSEISGFSDDSYRLMYGSNVLKSVDACGKVLTLEDYNIHDQAILQLTLIIWGS